VLAHYIRLRHDRILPHPLQSFMDLNPVILCYVAPVSRVDSGARDWSGRRHNIHPCCLSLEMASEACTTSTLLCLFALSRFYWSLRSNGSLWLSYLRQICRKKYILRNVIFEVFTAVTMKNAAFLDMETQFVPHRRH
jgi:hypothetical protein